MLNKEKVWRKTSLWTSRVLHVDSDKEENIWWSNILWHFEVCLLQICSSFRVNQTLYDMKVSCLSSLASCLCIRTSLQKLQNKKRFNWNCLKRLISAANGWFSTHLRQVRGVKCFSLSRQSSQEKEHSEAWLRFDKASEKQMAQKGSGQSCV